ncbi:MAG: LTA synthase family protein, partial [Rikenellaceae bacterium]|nr:LTA synthase family protein [Rikenellaceae bacterium]
SVAGNTTSADSSMQLLKNNRPNIVLIMLESIGRTVMDEVVDGREVAPNLQRLKREGIWFENMYANSYRTDRGTVAVMSGYAAHPVVSVMKYPQKAHTLPAIARSLQNEGYATSFMYGGDANFTNTISYLYGTGVERITDKAQLSFDAPTNKWGYADDVVCPYFAEEVLSLSKQDKPFFATLLTLSSHEPFDVPYSAFEDKILNSVAFTDDAVGKMIERWRNSPEWNNMLVILIADHGMPYPSELTTGAEERQRIPMIWTGGALEQSGMAVDTFCSQADLAATLLAQMGIANEDFIFSHDIFDNNQPHYAFWTWNNAFGLKDNEGKIIYNLTGDKTIQSEGVAPVYEQVGKAIVQTIHQDIRKR